MKNAPRKWTLRVLCLCLLLVGCSQTEPLSTKDLLIDILESPTHSTLDDSKIKELLKRVGGDVEYQAGFASIPEKGFTLRLTGEEVTALHFSAGRSLNAGETPSEERYRTSLLPYGFSLNDLETLIFKFGEPEEIEPPLHPSIPTYSADWTMGEIAVSVHFFPDSGDIYHISMSNANW